jgi:hypothetical protein
MALLSKAQINAADDRKWEDVPVPEWGGEVRVRVLTGTERDAYEALGVVAAPNGAMQRRLPTDARTKLLVMCLVDADFQRLYTDKEVKDLAAKNGEIIDRLFDVATRLSAIGKHAVEAKKGNSGAAQSGSSTSD